MSQFDLRDARRKVFMSELKPLEKLVALALLDHWSAARTEPFPSIARLANWTSASRCTVMRALAGLEQAGAIVPTRKTGQRSGAASRRPKSPEREHHSFPWAGCLQILSSAGWQ